MNRPNWILAPILVAATAAGCELCDRVSGRQSGTPPAAVAAAPPAPAAPGVLPITPANASIEFTGSTALQSHKGHFAAFDGTLEMPADDPSAAKIRVVVDVDSTTTSIGLLTKHLKGEDFFAAAQFPKAEFTSQAITPGAGPGEYRVSGTMSFHGVQKPVEFPARITVTPEEVSFDGTLVLRQTEFGMDEGARKTKDEVPVRVSIRARRK